MSSYFLRIDLIFVVDFLSVYLFLYHSLLMLKLYILVVIPCSLGLPVLSLLVLFVCTLCR